MVHGYQIDGGGPTICGNGEARFDGQEEGVPGYVVRDGLYDYGLRIEEYKPGLSGNSGATEPLNASYCESPITDAFGFVGNTAISIEEDLIEGVGFDTYLSLIKAVYTGSDISIADEVMRTFQYE